MALHVNSLIPLFPNLYSGVHLYFRRRLIHCHCSLMRLKYYINISSIRGMRHGSLVLYNQLHASHQSPPSDLRSVGAYVSGDTSVDTILNPICRSCSSSSSLIKIFGRLYCGCLVVVHQHHTTLQSLSLLPSNNDDCKPPSTPSHAGCR